MANESQQKLLDFILEQLFVAEFRRLRTNVSKLNRQNNEVRRAQADGFMLNGLFYRDMESPPSADCAPALDLSLMADGLSFIADRDKVHHERQLIKQTLNHLVTGCSSSQDLRDALPDCLRDTLTQEINRLSRTREEAYTIRDNPRALRQYQKILPRIEFYSAARLLY